MTEMLQAGMVPQWDLGDRMGKALRESGVSVAEMADYLQVNRNTPGRYISGRTKPTRATILAWALRTGVPAAWLELGVESPNHGPDTGVRARTGSNRRPEDYKLRRLICIGPPVDLLDNVHPIVEPAVARSTTCDWSLSEVHHDVAAA